MCFSWNFENNKLGEHAITTRKNAKSLNITTCGNYVLIGDSGGHIYKYNLQSGLSRGEKRNAHKNSIEFIDSDIQNEKIVTASLDKKIKVWDFKDLNEIGSIDVGESVSMGKLFRSNSLLAVACDDLSIRVYDIDTLKLVRTFVGHTNIISDLTFSNDCKWIVSCSSDTTIRTWDLLSGHLIDSFSVEKIPKKIVFSSSGEYIATIHSGDKSVFIWTNISHFKHVILKPITDPFAPAYLPSQVSDQLEDEEDSNEMEDEKENLQDSLEHFAKENSEEQVEEEKTDSLNENFKVKPQIENELTLSRYDKSKWLKIYNLDLIKERNQVKEKETNNIEAPFFLPTPLGKKIYDAPHLQDINSIFFFTGTSSVLPFDQVQETPVFVNNTKSPFQSLLEEADQSNNCNT